MNKIIFLPLFLNLNQEIHNIYRILYFKVDRVFSTKSAPHFSITLFIIFFTFEAQQQQSFLYPSRIISTRIRIYMQRGIILLNNAIFYMIFSTFSQIISQIKMMNQGNMWLMVYYYPQICYEIPQNSQLINSGGVLSKEKVERKISQKQKQEIRFKKLPNEIFQTSQRTRVSNKSIEEENQDSSFSLPMKQQYKTSQQKLGRNSASNILRLFTKMLKSSIFKEKYTEIKQKYGIETSFKEFNSWVTGIGLNMNKYIRMKKILNGIRTKPKFGRILSILYSIFQSKFARTAALTSAKTQSKNILPTLIQIRNIKEQINEAVMQGFSLNN